MKICKVDEFSKLKEFFLSFIYATANKIMAFRQGIKDDEEEWKKKKEKFSFLLYLRFY